MGRDVTEEDLYESGTVSASQKAAAGGKLDAALTNLSKTIDAAAGDAKMQQLLVLLAKLLNMDASCSRALPLLQEVLPAVEALLTQLPPGFFEPLAHLGSLDGGQADVLREVDAALREEYWVRRRMLIERVKVTLQSFLWSPRVAEEGTKAEVEALIKQCQGQLQDTPGVPDRGETAGEAGAAAVVAVTGVVVAGGEVEAEPGAEVEVQAKVVGLGACRRRRRSSSSSRERVTRVQAGDMVLVRQLAPGIGPYSNSSSSNRGKASLVLAVVTTELRGVEVGGGVVVAVARPVKATHCHPPFAP
ncbi:hypothetical protein COO60DRAFT_1638882 [Scenedesmus sp. NREL 46B-D3]|nr:hypothetical protein COO60DRAFT_1638882 [Scenedesmus sp. NREL 46B-D3]